MSRGKKQSDDETTVCVCDLAQSAVDSCKEMSAKVAAVRKVAEQIRDCCDGKGKKPSTKKQEDSEDDNKTFQVYAAQTIQKKINEGLDDDCSNEIEFVEKSDCEIWVAAKKPKKMPAGVKYFSVANFLKICNQPE